MSADERFLCPICQDVLSPPLTPDPTPAPVAVPWTCQRCREPTDDYVFTAAGGLCDDCFTEEYLEECHVCGEHFEHDALTRSYIAITDDVPAMPGPDLCPGIYQVLGRPFVTEALIGTGWYSRRALRFVAPLDPLHFESWEPGGWVCHECLWLWAYVPR